MPRCPEMFAAPSNHEGLGDALAAMAHGSIASFTARSAVKLESALRRLLERELAAGQRGHRLPVPNLDANAR